jgi:hypothetical protein
MATFVGILEEDVRAGAGRVARTVRMEASNLCPSWRFRHSNSDKKAHTGDGFSKKVLKTMIDPAMCMKTKDKMAK